MFGLKELTLESKADKDLSRDTIHILEKAYTEEELDYMEDMENSTCLNQPSTTNML